MYWYCGYCWYTGTSHSISLYEYVTGTALVLLFICTGTVGTVGTLVHWYQPPYLSVPICYWYSTGTAFYMYWYSGYCWYTGTSHSVSVPICYWYHTGTAFYMYRYCGYCWYIGTSHSMSLHKYVTGTALVLLFICTGTVGTVGTLVPAILCLCTNMLLVQHWYCFLYVLVQWVLLVHWYQPLCLCAYMLLVPHWYCFLYVPVLWVLLVHWYQPLYVSAQICYWYCTSTALYMYWHCGYCWYIGTSHSISLYQYVTGTALVRLFICTGTVGTVGTLVPATQCLCTNMLLVLHWYCCLYVLVLWVLSVHWYQPLYVSVPICYWYCTGTAVYMYWYCGYCGCIGTSHTLCLCTNLLLVLHWYCSLYVLVLWVLLVHWYQPLNVSVPICYWYCTGTAVYMYWYCGYCWYTGTCHSVSVPICYWYCTGTDVYMYWYCGYCWYIGTSHSISLYQYVTGTAQVLHWYCSLYVLVLWVLLVHWYQPLYVFVPICYWYCTGTAVYMYWYCGYCRYTGTSHSMSLYQYVIGTALVLLFICTGTVGTVGTLVPATLSLCLYVTGTALVLLFICTGTVGTVGTFVPATLCLHAYMLLVPRWYCCLYVLVLLVPATLCLCA